MDLGATALFQGCVKCIVIISEAQHVGRDVERLSLMLEWEQYRFLRWAERAGLCSQDTQPDPRLNWKLAHQLLSQLHDGLSNAETLRERYNLESCDGTQNAFQETAATESQTTAKRRSGRLLGRSWVKASENVRKSRSQYIQQQTSTFKKLRWVEMDEEKTRRLLTDISFFNNALQDLLDDRHQESMRVGMEALMRDLLSRSVDLSDIETIKAFVDDQVVTHATELEGASQVKETRLLLGVDKKLGEDSTGQAKLPALKKINYENITNLRPFNHDGSWAIGEYRVVSSKRTAHSHVLLEWKRVETRIETKIKNRIMELALLLSVSSDAAFHSLKCLGFLKRNMPGQDHNMYAYVFEIADLLGAHTPSPQQTTVQPQPVPIPFSLRSAFNEPRKPSLSERLKICLAISEAVLQMHTAGWLHKNIRPDNILFLSTTAPKMWSTQEGYTGPYISGFEFARNTLEETETMPFDDRQTLYKHPDLTETGQLHVHLSFRKRYDMHSLACVLVEVATWSTLEDILSSEANAQSLADKTNNDNNNSSGSNAASTLTSTSTKSEAQSNYEKRLRLRQTKSALLKTRDTARPILDRVAFAGGDRLRDAIASCFFPSVTPENRVGDSSGGSGSNSNIKPEKFENDGVGDGDDDDDDDEEEILEASVEIQLYVVNTLRSLCVTI